MVVTGATGFLARHLLPLLAPRVTACVRSRQAWSEQSWTSKLEARVAEIPLSRLSTDSNEVGPARTVLHLAGRVEHSRRDAASLCEVNVGGTLEATRLAARLGARLVLASTSGTVGCFRDPDCSADESAPFCEATVRHWPYYHSKIVAERSARELAHTLGVQLVVVRFPILLGPDDHRRRSTGHVRRFVEGRLPFLVRGGIQVVDVRDVAQALATLVDIDSPRPTYHLAGFSGATKEFFGRCNDVSGRPAPRNLPFGLAWAAAALENRVARALNRKAILPDPVVIEMARHWWRIRSVFADEIGFVARPLEQTLADTIAWLRADVARASGPRSPGH